MILAHIHDLQYMLIKKSDMLKKEFKDNKEKLKV